MTIQSEQEALLLGLEKGLETHSCANLINILLNSLKCTPNDSVHEKLLKLIKNNITRYYGR